MNRHQRNKISLVIHKWKACVHVNGNHFSSNRNGTGLFRNGIANGIPHSLITLEIELGSYCCAAGMRCECSGVVKWMEMGVKPGSCETQPQKIAFIRQGSMPALLDSFLFLLSWAFSVDVDRSVFLIIGEISWCFLATIYLKMISVTQETFGGFLSRC